MPSKSPEQAKLMRAIAHGWKMPGGDGPTKAVASEFMHADMKRQGKMADIVKCGCKNKANCSC